jgi:TP901 family phage tail tape measure protein
MADELISKLGFDASDAIKALESMDEKMASLEGHFGSLASAMSAWNSSAQATISVLKELATHANAAASAMGKLNNNMNKGSGGAAATAPPPPPPTPSKQLWLPPGVKEEIEALKPPLKDVGEELDKTKTKAGGFTISLQMLSRIVITQAIVRALSAIRDAFSEAFTSSMEFQKRIAELNSIMGGETKDAMEPLKRQIASLAQEFNFPIAQVAEAEYQAVSAQFTSTSQRADVMSASMKLAKIGCMELSTSVTLVSSALNAYGMSSSQADTVAAKFFRTVQDGKVRGEELAASLGKVMPVAAELGVSLDEVNTAIVQLTVSGIKAPEASTSLRSALMALIKPSSDLKKSLKELGFDSGEQAIGALGLMGALNALRSTTDETIASCVKLFPNIRAQNTILRETGERAGKAAEELQKMQAANAEGLNKAYKIFIDTNAEKVSAELNKMKVWLATELGPALLTATASILNWVGGIGTLTTVISALAGPITVMAGVLTGLTLIVKGHAFALDTAAGKMTMFGSAVTIAGAAMAVWATYNWGVEKLKNDLNSALTEYHKVADEWVATQDAAARKITQGIDKVNEAAVQGAEKQMAAINKSYTDQINVAKDKDQELVESTKSTMEALVSAKEKGVHMLADLVKESDKAIEDSQKRVAKDRMELEDVEFKFRQKRDETNDELANRKFQKKEKTPEEQRVEFTAMKHEREDESMAEKLAREGSKQLSTAKSPEELSVAEATFKRAEAYGQMAMSAAEKAHSTTAEASAERTILDIVHQRMAAEKQFQQLKAQQAAAASEAKAKEQKDANDMRTQMKDIMGELSLFDKKTGEPMKPEDREKHIAKVKEQMDAFQAKAFSTGNWDISAAINFTEFRRKMMDNLNGAVTEVQIKDLKATPESLKKLNQMITEGVGIIELYKQFTGNKVDFTGMTGAEAHQAAINFIKKEREETDKWRQANDDVGKSYKQIFAEANAIQGIQDTMFNGANNAFRGLGAMAGALILNPAGKAAQTRDELNKDYSFYASRPQSLTQDKYEEITKKFGTLKASGTAYSGDIEGLQKEQDILEKNYKLWLHIKEIKTGQAEPGAIGEAQQHLNTLPDLRPATNIGSMVNRQEELNNLFAMADAESAKTNRNLEAGADALKQQAASAKEVEQALLNAAATNGLPGQGQGQAVTLPPHAAGGAIWNWLADGGSPRGRDTIHAMLSPGEMVINERSARKFGAQLTAMNAGSRPNYHSHGGSVTNVGDINVHVGGGNSATGTGRQIANEIRRELRRGSSTL